MKTYLIALLIWQALTPVAAALFDKEQSVVGRFVAYDRFAGLSNPREPKQELFFEVQEGGALPRGTLIRLLYFPNTTSMRGGARFLDLEMLKYERSWRLIVTEPISERERASCARVDGYFRSADGTIDENELGEPAMRFRSTQFEADIRFDTLAKIPCFVLRSMTPTS
jgi:hypothetical protein